VVSAIIVAGGKGSRMGQDINKQYIKVNGKEILLRTLEIFNSISKIDEIILVVPYCDIEFCREHIVEKNNIHKVSKIVQGGSERQESVHNGLLNCKSGTEIVVIHDGARPFVTEEIVEGNITCAREFDACTTAVPAKDTIKIVGEDMFSIGTPDRKSLFAVQTPQSFRYDLILKAHQNAKENNIIATDDTMLIEKLGFPVRILEGSYSNIKITTPEDLIFAEAIINAGIKKER
jgi:2-C-methyl-D-erythritol 4-phosphate cytidylyltransferase